MDRPGISLQTDALIRAVAVNRGTPHVFFLGAGASITSGVPSVDRCIWEWKREIFLTNNPGLEAQFSELSLPSVRQEIQRWLDRRGGFPAAGSPEEYGFYIERCFPVSEDRRAWFERAIRPVRPHVGYKALCALAQAGIAESAWSTNFDMLAARAAADFNLSAIEVGLDTGGRLPRTVRSGEFLCVALHGDYRYDRLRNTPAELQVQDRKLRDRLIERIKNRPLIVAGYSGRDDSVMDALRSAYSAEGLGALYWCTYGDEDVPPRVLELIEAARRCRRAAFLVPTQGFDDLLARLALRCLDDEASEGIRTKALEAIEQALEREPFAVEPVAAGSLIKSNAFVIQCPSEVYEFEPTEWPEERAWAWVEEKTKGRDVVAVPFRNRIVCMGDLDSIRSAFDGLVKGPVERTPIVEADLRLETGAIVSLLRRALVRSIASTWSLKSDGRARLWDPVEQETRREGGREWSVHDSAVLYLRRIGTKQYLILKPSVTVRAGDGSEAPEDVERRVRLAVLGWQHNNKFNRAVERWRRRLLSAEQPRFHYPPGSQTPFTFKVRRTPIFAALRARSGGNAVRIPENVGRHVTHHGFELEEPQLVFSSKDGCTAARDFHPIRGIAKNRPYDYSMTERGLAPSVRLAVVCPESETQALRDFLQRARQRHSPLRADRDYLLDFPGFDAAFGLPLELPSPSSPSWHSYPVPAPGTHPRTGALELARSITGALDAVGASSGPSVVLVYVPDHLDQWKRFRTESEHFDVHDFVKAYCVPHGITTQFLEGHTLREPQQCRVWWWLSLALYVKSMRTPWVLDVPDSHTAFVGLGYSIDRNSERGRHVVLGCSHIYNSRGEGLQYRLTRVEDPVFRGRNPFLSREDARRVGETIRQLFYEAKMRLPGRVVLHKRTPFRREERDGLLEGLGGIDEVDMLEINVDPALRYVSSIAKPGGRFDEDNYPVDRGSVVRLDGHTALLWVHGVATALDARLRYYQGKRRIPAPLVLRRHAGRSDLSLTCSEILGLSKMNFNTFDLYTRLPATVESSGQIARIGSLLERFGTRAYDYRLFI